MQHHRGFFKNPAASDATKQSCIACGDETGADQYKGRSNCATCTAPAASNSGGTATCTKCVSPKYLKAGARIDSCDSDNTEFPKEDTNNGNRCVSCGDQTDGITDCQECSKTDTTLKCSACNGDKKPNADRTKCVDCTAAGCAKCSDENVCVECSTDKLTPTGQCVDDCGTLGGYYADSDVCKPCDPSCTACIGANANQCSACPAGKVLQYTTEGAPENGGSCVDECKTGAGGCADCGATIGGSKYCSRCSDTNQAPLNGNCAANTARTKFCTNASNGACTQCANNYFLLDGGCYETSRQPGKSVCTTANNGQCQMCDNGQSLSSGICPACPADARSVVTQTLVLSASLDTIFLLIHV